ncbi:MAG: 4-hydroxy-tetrahydrodipicolinate synthase [Bacteroides sp.]|nr:4-hydroxy-tetrahydrodipicolinate synthase [Bacteroides sp.]MBD5320285.1 4-hydroxy-tetrahydrodipicolinate synthase [Bacteroides sp.]MBD5421614.1 4-hydroxy-tetrahydrodipicolinate synthase [Bacteroides sp.]MDE6051663.1 4-hydroxy-tetrahydrodipicolinate synthase [Paramuribaculum sp.]
MSQINLQGMGVALVTPFKADKSIDWDTFAHLLDYQIDNGVDYLVVLGTTSENPTLEPSERAEIRQFVTAHVAGRVPLVLGCGGNNTSAVIRELLTTDLSAFSAILSVVPFYNKPSQEGIYAHYAAIAKSSPLPVILYNVPGRTGVNMTAETTLRLAADFPNIVGIKEASGNMVQVDEIIKHKSPDFMVISGDDAVTFPLITLGAVGVISVIGNAFPREFSRMVRLALEGDYAAARTIHHRFNDLFGLLFVDGNPAGVKCVLNLMGLCENELRLPLVPTRITTHERIRLVLNSLKALQTTNH